MRCSIHPYDYERIEGVIRYRATVPTGCPSVHQHTYISLLIPYGLACIVLQELALTVPKVKQIVPRTGVRLSIYTKRRLDSTTGCQLTWSEDTLVKCTVQHCTSCTIHTYAHSTVVDKVRRHLGQVYCTTLYFMYDTYLCT